MSTRPLLVAMGGLIGSVARYWVAGVVQGLTGVTFPFGTLLVNVAGSLILGLVMTLSLDRGMVGADLRLFLAVGVCGGFTTMSTFSYETVALLRDGETILAAGNVLVTVLVCLAAVVVGQLVGRVL